MAHIIEMPKLSDTMTEFLSELRLVRVNLPEYTPGCDADPAKVANVRRELSALEKTWMAHPAAAKDVARLRAELKAVNERLWVIEDDIREKERAQAFDAEFIKLARSVYVQNDERARIKRDINTALGSTYVEEKSYADYGAGPTA